MEYEGLRRSLVDRLVREGHIRSGKIRDAFLSVERERFVPENFRPYSYDDRPLPIGDGQTISAPSMVAIMLEESDLGEDMQVLEIGTGSGYNACLIGRLVGNGNVTSIERIDVLCERAKRNLVSCKAAVKVVCGDGTLGYAPDSPYDRIIITAAAPCFPKPLVKQLKVGGKIIAPIGDSGIMQQLMIGTKNERGDLSVESMGYCVFVPLIGKYGF
ncbi:MAG TPA: protein-L-isoaspartate(D-aspartate) O-methyltransferase [Candidatus Methanofastidiosa archaeon]|nr:protein-L-isoaspartate(D-aspartate) O-methyltransferase [Candidatus Methanofastidiosa archaeon]HPR41035.1 protein-L-isoaspartate(D-aspartate) O-methyltransferase [Candidatus Methanofastidiosa archaeon]